MGHDFMAAIRYDFTGRYTAFPEEADIVDAWDPEMQRYRRRSFDPASRIDMDRLFRDQEEAVLRGGPFGPRYGCPPFLHKTKKPAA